MDPIIQAANALRKAKRVAVLSGAGASAESGVPTFRASDGLWEGHRIEEVATPSGFKNNPNLVWQFYNARRANVRQVQPNPGHYALAELEKRYGHGFYLATQNVDGLHQRAGSVRVGELHGSLYRTRCTKCGEIVDQGLNDLEALPKCSPCGGLLRPDIVWFHENLPEAVWEEANVATAMCDVFLIVGTSAVVYPAAGLIHLAKEPSFRGAADPATVIEFNLTETAASEAADIGVYGPSGITLPKVLAAMNS